MVAGDSATGLAEGKLLLQLHPRPMQGYEDRAATTTPSTLAGVRSQISAGVVDRLPFNQGR